MGKMASESVRMSEFVLGRCEIEVGSKFDVFASFEGMRGM